MGSNSIFHTFGESCYIETSDGRKLHYMEQGIGELTVVFESGMGMSRSTWGLVQPYIAAHTRTIVYDRAGSGKSEVDHEARTLARIANDLDCLLKQLGQGPFILVGHSWGGPIVRMVAAMNPERIRGLVLVDQTDEHCELYFEEKSVKHYARMSRLLPLMAGVGLYKLIGSKGGRVQPKDVYRDHYKEDFTIQAAKTMIAEGRYFLDDLRVLKEQPLKLQAVEVSVISGTLVTPMERRFRPALHEAHQQTTSTLMNARLIEAPNSGHMIMYSEPQLIADEIKRMLDKPSIKDD